MWWPRRQGVRGLLLGQGAPGRACAGTVPAQGTGDTGGHISTEPRINERIRVPEVRLVGPAGEQIGIVAINDALRLAQEADLDLVEVAPTARPPVCKLMDYGKFKYESALKARESRKNQAQTVIKEIKLRPKIDPHDYGTKKGHVERFLKAGDKVKVTIMFRGREQSRPELGYKLLQRLAGDVEELGFVESAPKQDGRNMIMVIGPHKRKTETRPDVRPERSDARSERAERQAARTAASVAAGSERASATASAGPAFPVATEPRPAAPAAAAASAAPAAPRPATSRPAAQAAPRPASPRPSSPRPAAPAAPRPASPRPAAPGAAARPAPRPAAPPKPAPPAKPAGTGAPASPGGTASPAPRPSAPRPAPPRPSPPRPGPRPTAPRPRPVSPVPAQRAEGGGGSAKPAESAD
jgi:translation initiation factor IF-3